MALRLACTQQTRVRFLLAAPKMKATKIKITYEDGSVMGTSGKDLLGEFKAEAIMKWWNSCEGLAFAHGWKFDAEPLKKAKKAVKKKKK